ncbi:immunoglobulin domain-containing protein [Candidatus Sumerlaeota bacterium]
MQRNLIQTDNVNQAAISAYAGSSDGAQHNIIADNVLRGLTRGTIGIDLQSGAAGLPNPSAVDWDVRGNTIENFLFGIRLQNILSRHASFVRNILLASNRITLCEAGILLRGVRDTDGDGLSAIVVSDNDLLDNDYGLRLDTDPNLLNNVNFILDADLNLDGNPSSAINIDTSDWAIFGNNIVGNAAFGMLNQNPSTALAVQDNWWGSYTGPGQLDPGGRVGDTVSTGVLFTPWTYGEFRNDFDGDLQNDDVDLDDDGDTYLDLDELIWNTDPLHFDVLGPNVVSIVRLEPSPTQAQTVSFQITFDDNLTSLTFSDLGLYAPGLTSPTVTQLAGGPAVFNVTVHTGIGMGILRLDVIDHDTVIGSDGFPLGGPGIGNGTFTDGEPYLIIRRGALSSPFEQGNGRFGGAVSDIEDVTGDGLTDVLVGAYQENPAAAPAGSGAAHIFNGLTGSLVQALVSPNPTFDGNFGYSVSGVPDINGDGVPEALIGAPGESVEGPTGTIFEAGRAYVFHGASGALLYTLESPTPQDSGEFGTAVAGIGDINGDGRGDFIVGSPGEDGGVAPLYAGRVHVFSGATGQLIRTLESPNAKVFGNFGISVDAVPDVNGDATPDMIIGADWEGRAYIVSGADGAFLWTLDSPDVVNFASFGFQVTGVPDLNGDGLGDVAVGGYTHDLGVGPANAGRVYVYSGTSGTLLQTLESPNAKVDGAFGISLSGVADLSGDGLGDIIIGGCYEDLDPNWSSALDIDPALDFATISDTAGNVYVFDGARGELLFPLHSPSPQPWGCFGAAVSGLADVNDDGLGDVLVGAFGEDGLRGSLYGGQAYVFSGASTSTLALSIVTQPTSATVPLGTPATFSIVADGTPPLFYQWFHGANSLSDDARISGANSATLTISPATLSDEGEYLCLVSNGWGSILSITVQLTVDTSGASRLATRKVWILME